MSLFSLEDNMCVEWITDIRQSVKAKRHAAAAKCQFCGVIVPDGANTCLPCAGHSTSDGEPE